jgi:hypothetical protein
MRHLEITIMVYLKRVSELLGENDRSTDVQRRCVIDLERVESFWEDPASDGGDGLLVKMFSGDSYWTKSFTLNQFRLLVEGGCFKRVPMSDIVDSRKFHAVCHG